MSNIKHEQWGGSLENCVGPAGVFSHAHFGYQHHHYMQIMVSIREICTLSILWGWSLYKIPKKYSSSLFYCCKPFYGLWHFYQMLFCIYGALCFDNHFCSFRSKQEREREREQRERSIIMFAFRILFTIFTLCRYKV